MSQFSRRLFAFSAAILGLSVASASAQEVQVFSFEGSGEKPQVALSGGLAISGSLGGGAMFGVDPNNRSALFNLLANESIRRELKVDENQYAGVQKIMRNRKNE